MHIGRKVAAAWMSVLCLGILLGVLIPPLQAADFVDRSTPMSQRPFAKPFIDRSSPISERPLAPIGVGPQVTPDPVPLVWCHGAWVRADRVGQSCASR